MWKFCSDRQPPVPGNLLLTSLRPGIRKTSCGPVMQMLEFVQNHSDPDDPREMMDATALMGALGALRQSIGDKLNIPENELAVLYTFPSITKLDDLPPEIRELWPL
jgi:hypothetical protein